MWTEEVAVTAPSYETHTQVPQPPGSSTCGSGLLEFLSLVSGGGS